MATAGTAAAVTKISDSKNAVRGHGQSILFMPSPIWEEQFYGRTTGSPSSLSAGDLRIGQKQSRCGDTGRGKDPELLESPSDKNGGRPYGHETAGTGEIRENLPDGYRLLLAKDMLRCVELIQERLPALGLDLTGEEARDFVRTMVVDLPEHCRRRLAGRT